MSHRSQAQKRAGNALRKIEGLAGADDKRKYGNYRAYVNGLPATILTNGLGQALAMELAGSGKDVGHRLLYDHLDDWLRGGWESSPYGGARNVLDAIANGDERNYIRAQAEAMAYLEWLKKFANAMLKRLDEGDAEQSAGRD